MSDRKGKLIGAAEAALAAASSLCFGVSFGHSYGVDNQVVYILGALRLLDPTILQRDWFSNRTTHYHPTFKYLAAALLGIDHSGWAVALLQTLAIAGGMLCVYALLRGIVGARRALPSFLLVLAVSLFTRTGAAGGTYVFDWTLQPSTMGSVGLLAAAAFFARERWLASGVCAAASGLFHLNYLVLLIPALFVAHLALGRRDLWKRLLLQLALPVGVVLLFLPVLLGAAGSPAVAEARQIIFHIRAPHHYEPARYLRAFLPSAMWLVLGAGGALYLARRNAPGTRQLAAFCGGLLVVVWGGVLFSTLIPIAAATQLFSWRIGPHANLLLQALVFAALITAVTDSGVARRALGGAWARAAVPGVLASSLVIFALNAAGQLRHYRKRSTLVSGVGQEEEDLYRWMREQSPKDAVFLTPPDVETMRFWGQRAIVVDWKSQPHIPEEVLEWLQRLKDVTGRPELSGRKDLDGYDSLDAARLSLLRARYGVDYVVVRRGRERDLGFHPQAFANGGYVVLDVRGGR